MVIGIDVSQLAYPNTGVANYLQNLVENLIETDKENKYILFFSSLRRDLGSSILDLGITKNQDPRTSVQIKRFRIPPILLDLLWNKLHILPIESFIGPIDVFITSDWTEPPTKRAKKATILYDLVVYKYPEETAGKIVQVQKRKLRWVIEESSKVFCISESTKKDAEEILGLDKSKLSVIYPGFN